MLQFIAIGFSIAAFVAGASLGISAAETPQNIIDQFKKPVCVEQTVGKDVIKKCYELKEVK